MPRFINNGYAGPVTFGQHYQRRTLLPGKCIYTPGICLGMALSWIRKVQIKQDFELSSIQNDGLQWEGAFMQSIAEHGYSTRLDAGPNDAAEFVQANELFAKTLRPSQIVLHGNLLIGLRRLGFSYRQKGDMVVFDIMNTLSSRMPPHHVTTYLLLGGGHALCVAAVNEDVALFDPSFGTWIYTRDEAIARYRLAGILRENVEGCSYPGFYVIEVNY